MFQTCSFLGPQMQPKSICLSAFPLLCQGIGVNDRLLSPALSSLAVTSWAKRNSKCVGENGRTELRPVGNWKENHMKHQETVKHSQTASMIFYDGSANSATYMAFSAAGQYTAIVFLHSRKRVLCRTKGDLGKALRNDDLFDRSHLRGTWYVCAHGMPMYAVINCNKLKTWWDF